MSDYDLHIKDQDLLIAELKDELSRRKASGLKSLRSKIELCHEIAQLHSEIQFLKTRLAAISLDLNESNALRMDTQ